METNSNKLTTKTITRTQIVRLLDESAIAGDRSLFRQAEKALAYFAADGFRAMSPKRRSGLRACVKAINEARAMAEE